jgi:HlyD family secretion protein
LKKRSIALGFALLLIGVSAFVYWGQRQRAATERYYSGSIEATQSDLAFQINGRIKQVMVDEGQPVTAGQVLAVLAASEWVALRDRAQAELSVARNTFENLENVLQLNQKVLPVEVERAEAALRSAQSQLLELESGYRTQEIEKARQSLEAARAARTEAERNKRRVDLLFDQNVSTERDKDAAALKFERANREFKAIEQTLAMLREGFRSEAIEAAEARRDEARAALKLAQENLKKIDISQKELSTARARVQVAEAAVKQAEIQLGHTRITAPFAGILVNRGIEQGEVVTPGQEVLSLSDLSTVELKIYVDEAEIGAVRIGQPVRVRIDTFPERDFQGQVAYISPEAEFTPKIIQTHKERVKLVFMVKINLANPELILKTGMPADAWLE